MQAQKRRFTSMDFILLMLCIAGIFALVLQGNLARTLGLEDVGSPADYTLSLTALTSEEAALFREGDTLIHPDTGEILGTVQTAQQKNATFYKPDEKGRIQESFDSTLFDLTLIVSGTGKESERGFLLNGSINATPGDLLPVSPDGKTAFEATVLPNE